jgi:hypothetical protein
MESVKNNSLIKTLTSYWSYILVILVVLLIVNWDQQLSSYLSRSFWAKFGLLEFPYKATLLFMVVVVAASLVIHFSLKARDLSSLLIVFLVIALQTNGIKFTGFDLIFILPFVIALLVLSESLRRPSHQIILPGVIFFAFLLLLLDVPYFITQNPARFIITFISVLKGVLVAFAIVNLIRDEKHLEIAINAVLIVAVVSAAIGIVQLALNYFTGITFSFVSADHRTKPTFLGVVLRASALTTWPSWLADFQIIAFPFLLFRLFNSRSLWPILGYSIAILISVTAVFLTFTYAAYFAIAATTVLFPFLYWPQKTFHFLVTILFTTTLLYIIGGIEWIYGHGLEKLQSSTGMIERKIYLYSALDEITRNPWLGSGFYADEELSGNYYRKRVHNTGLQAWVALGLPGFIVFITMMLTLLTQIWLLVLSGAKQHSQTLKSLGAALIGMIIAMFAEPNFSNPVIWFFLGFCQSAILLFTTMQYQNKKYASPFINSHT